MLFFAWTLYFAFQTWLAASGRVARHRTIGMIGVSLATAMTIFGFLAAVNVMKRSAAVGLADAGVAFAIVPLSGILFFAVVFTLAVANTRRPEIHKRLMLLAGISILDAAVARWFLTFLAPPGPVGPPPVEVTIVPALTAYLLLLAAIVFDWRTRGRPHPVVYLRRRRAGGRKTPELADQRHAGLAFARGRHPGAGAVARGTSAGIWRAGMRLRRSGAREARTRNLARSSIYTACCSSPGRCILRSRPGLPRSASISLFDPDRTWVNEPVVNLSTEPLTCAGLKSGDVQMNIRKKLERDL